jgi:hypothetical protein
MNDDKFNVFVVKRAIISILIIASTLLLLDLYVPLKRMLCGDILTFSEVVSYFHIRDHFSSVVAIGMLLVRSSIRKEENSTNLGHKQ